MKKHFLKRNGQRCHLLTNSETARASFMYGNRETNVQLCQLDSRLRGQMVTSLQLLCGPIQLCTYLYQDAMRLLT